MAATAELSLNHLPSNRQSINSLGLNPHEAKRLQQVTERVGWQYAVQEYKRNVESYKREFGADEPVSIPYNYYTINGATYTLPVADPLFSIETGIDLRERGGRMIEGWRKFDALTKPSESHHNAQPPLPNGVNIWYSAHGDSGLGFQFDSGRLYISVNTPEGSKHINIKVAPSFDVTKLLDVYASQANVIRPSFFRPNSSEDTEKVAMYYLTNPFAMGMNTNDFLKLNRALIEQGYMHPHEVVYRSKRNSPNAQDHTFTDIIDQFTEMLGYEQPSFASLKRSDIPRTEHDWKRGYIESILPYAYNGEIFLYGCSATSILKSVDLFNPYATMMRKGSVLMYGADVKERKEYSLTCPLCGWTGRADPCELTVCPGCSATNEQIQQALREREEKRTNPAGIYDGTTRT